MMKSQQYQSQVNIFQHIKTKSFGQLIKQGIMHLTFFLLKLTVLISSHSFYKIIIGWPMLKQQTHALTFNKLRIERIKQIEREGVRITIHRASYPNPSYFSFPPEHIQRVKALISNVKYMLEVCQETGEPACKISPTELYFPQDKSKQGCLLVSSSLNSQFNRRIQYGSSYFLARFNPTLSAYKGIYSHSEHQYDVKQIEESAHIYDYLTNTSIEVPSILPLTFAEQYDLNPPQNEAIKKAGKESLTFIKGPPGCGKTKTIARLCRLMVQKDVNVIVGAVSNTGNLTIVGELARQFSHINKLDQLLKLFKEHAAKDPVYFFQRLSQQYDKHIKINIVFFPPFDVRNDQISPQAFFYSLDTHIIVNLIKLSSIQDTHFILHEYSRLKAHQKISNKFYSLIMQARAFINSNARIVVSTTVKSKKINHKLSYEGHFNPDVAILDEASQSSCSDTLCFLAMDVKKLVLVGDEKQLDPTVVSNDKLLKNSYFITHSQKKQEYFALLSYQYRMHPYISILANHFFYENSIMDAVSVQQRMTEVEPFKTHPAIFINSPYHEKEETIDYHHGKKKTYMNPHQVYIIKAYLSSFHIDQYKDIGILTPYTQQLKLFQSVLQKQILENGLTVRTCDGYQGGEKDYIFISLVRANETGTIGFCNNQNRINVSITRAKKGMMIVGNLPTYAASMNFWHLIALSLANRGSFFDFNLQIPEESVKQIEQKLKISQNLVRPQPKLQKIKIDKNYQHQEYPDQRILDDYQYNEECNQEDWVMDSDDY